MGELYRAHDDRLRRDVAIKVSRDQFTERFTREARTIAALNHTNIAHLYDVGPNYLVMEYVEGPDLKGPLDFDDALPIIQQLIDGIEAAHEKNIIHRDLKPANIKVTPEGIVKILDFGLAKAMEPPADIDPENSPTLTMGGTVAGTILGTAAYMSPEQAKGKAADKRSDIFSFGVVLYEMLTGKRLFQGESVVEILSGVLHKEPDISAAPPRVHKLLGWCLEKDRKQRLSSISDARRLLLPEPALSPTLNGDRDKSTARAMLPWTAAIAFAIIAAVTAWLLWPHPSPPLVPMRFTVTLPEGVQLPKANPGRQPAVISPDGRYLVFVGGDPTDPQSLWVRELNSVSAQKLEKTQGASSPFWAPDSQSIAFFADGKLKRIPISGGTPQTLAEAVGISGAWSQAADGAGFIVFAPTNTGPLYRVAASGGVHTPVTKLGNGETRHAFPQILPDGRLLYHALGTKSGMYVQSMGGATSEAKLVLETSTRAICAAPGFLLFVREGTLFAQRVDPGSLALQGEATAIADNVPTQNSSAAFAVSENGVVLYRSGGIENERIVSYSRDGSKRTELGTEVGSYTQLVLSPDDTRLLVSRRVGSGSLDLWLLDLANHIFSRLTTGEADDADPVWSPDSRRVIFDSRGKGKREIHEITVGVGTEKTLDPSSEPIDDWTRNGKLLVSHSLSVGVSIRAIAPENAESKPQLVFPSSFGLDEIHISPDGQWAAYESNESGQFEIYVARFPAFTERRQISTGGGVQPQWRSDGRELFYLSTDSKMMAVDMRPGAALQSGMPRALFQTAFPSVTNLGHYAPSRDGQRFYGIEPQSTAAVEPIYVIVNWPALVK